jgi:hypothetical protein
MLIRGCYDIEFGKLNAETLEAIKELDEGGGTRYQSVEELFNDLGIGYIKAVNRFRAS